MAYRGKGCPAPRNHRHRGHPGLIWRLDADLSAHPLYSLIATVVCARMGAFSNLAQREWHRRVTQVV